MNGAPAPVAPVTFVLDSNIFIEAKQRYYAFDVCPGFWQALVWQYGQGMIVSIDRVKNELVDFDDELKTWTLTTMPASCFIATDTRASARRLSTGHHMGDGPASVHRCG